MKTVFYQLHVVPHVSNLFPSKTTRNQKIIFMKILIKKMSIKNPNKNERMECIYFIYSFYNEFSFANQQ